jgi:hypothetical protein
MSKRTATEVFMPIHIHMRFVYHSLPYKYERRKFYRVRLVKKKLFGFSACGKFNTWTFNF